MEEVLKTENIEAHSKEVENMICTLYDEEKTVRIRNLILTVLPVIRDALCEVKCRCIHILTALSNGFEY
jgi:hypothetical protein